MIKNFFIGAKAGQFSGAAARIKNQYSKALYVHFASHRFFELSERFLVK